MISAGDLGRIKDYCNRTEPGKQESAGICKTKVQERLNDTCGTQSSQACEDTFVEIVAGLHGVCIASRENRNKPNQVAGCMRLHMEKSFEYTNKKGDPRIFLINGKVANFGEHLFDLKNPAGLAAVNPTSVAASGDSVADVIAAAQAAVAAAESVIAAAKAVSLSGTKAANAAAGGKENVQAAIVDAERAIAAGKTALDQVNGASSVQDAIVQAESAIAASDVAIAAITTAVGTIAVDPSVSTKIDAADTATVAANTAIAAARAAMAAAPVTPSTGTPDSANTAIVTSEDLANTATVAAPIVNTNSDKADHDTTGSFELLVLPTAEGADSPAYAVGQGSLSVPVVVEPLWKMTLNGSLVYKKAPVIGRDFGDDFALIHAMDPGKRKLQGTLSLKATSGLDANRSEAKVTGSLEVGQVKRSPLLGTGAGVIGGVSWKASSEWTLGSSLYLGSWTSYSNLLVDGKEFNEGPISPSLQLTGEADYGWLKGEALLALDRAGEGDAQPGATMVDLGFTVLPFELEGVKIEPGLGFTYASVGTGVEKDWVAKGKATYGDFVVDLAYTYADGTEADQAIAVDTGNTLDEPATGEDVMTGLTTYTIGQDRKEFQISAGYLFIEKSSLSLGYHYWLNQEEQTVTFPGGSDEVENTSGTRDGLYLTLNAKF